jgi:hypothetical protein
MYKNRKMRSIETIPGMGDRRYRIMGVELDYNIL